jgi:Methyltransferase domain
LLSVIDKEELILATLSSPHKSGGISKAIIRPFLIKEKLVYQVTENRQQQAFHHNFSKEECLHWMTDHLSDFKQTFVYTASADYHILLGKKGNLTLLKKPPSKTSSKLMHDRQKEYLLQEGVPAPFLVHLGVMNAEGKVYAAKKHKFRQINRFLEMIEDVLPHLDFSRRLRIVDFGCGKAYLTFALFHYLRVIKGFRVQLTGLDLKRDVIQYCQEVAKSLGYESDLQFIQGDIDH